ncbi:hypothetical protein Aduo_003720 [Ancylostoma duodenale]
MTAAAMNENLGNIVLVKNRHKAQQGMKSPAAPGSGDDFQQPLVMDQQAAAVAGYPSSTTRTSTTTTTPTTTNIQPGAVPDAQQQAVQQFYQRQDVAFGSPAPPPQVSMVPLGGASTTTTTTPASGPYGTPYSTTAATTTGPSTTGPTPTTTAPTTGSTMGRPTVERTDELTKKETTEEKPVCDRAQKWKTYVEKTLEGGVETMLAEFRLIRGHIPPFCTRMGFDANVEKNRFEDFLRLQNSDISVGEFKRVVIDRDWTMHAISVRCGDRRRFVHMHHYSGWTHGKQPVRITDLWQIQSVFRKYTHPHVYMSLSGCGRAGTYAAFEIAHERLHSDNFQKLNISDCVCRARNGRMHSVQRPIQMQSIHAFIMEHIMGTKFSTVLPPKTVQKYEEFSARFNRCAELQEDLQ